MRLCSITSVDQHLAVWVNDFVTVCVVKVFFYIIINQNLEAVSCFSLNCRPNYSKTLTCCLTSNIYLLFAFIRHLF